MRQRLDVEMTQRRLVESREQAQCLIAEGRVRVNSHPAGKSDLRVDSDDDILIIGTERKYASRGGYKLAAALDAFRLSVTERMTLDVGASTGGFTDVLLSRGAARVIALDVGRGQLAERLRNDRRVIVIERANVRFVAPDMLPYRPDLVTIDVSFISLKLVLPVIVRLTLPPADMIVLIKPQFEAGRKEVGRGGVVRDEAVRSRVMHEIIDFAANLGLKTAGVIDSPIRGPAGNLEMLALLQQQSSVQ